MKDEAKKVKLYSRRSFLLLMGKMLLFATTILRFGQLQLGDVEKYKNLSAKNSVKIQPILPARGLIKDRDGVILATNVNKFYLLASNEKQEAINKISHILPNKFSELSYDSKKLALELDWNAVVQIEEHLNDLPELEIQKIPKRYYPYADVSSSLVGYVGRANEQQDYIISGKDGIEHSMNEALSGKLGAIEYEVNAHGTIVKKLAMHEPVQGNPLELSVSMELHRLVADIMPDRKAVVVVQDVRNGEVLCLYSQPSYDANRFIAGFSNKEWQVLQSDPDHVLINRAISARYPPGSTFKLITALAALGHGIDSSYGVECLGYHKVGNRVFHCWNKFGHDYVPNVEVALQKSCNVYFYRLAEMVGINSIYKVAKALGLCDKTGIELPHEVAGLVPNPSWKEQRLGKKWVKGDTINACIGQGFVNVTIAGLNNMVASIAAGRKLQPSLLRNNKDFKLLSFDSKHLEILRRGMFKAVNKEGGAMYVYGQDIPHLGVCGKTGTAQVVSLDNKNGPKEHSLFSGFAPFDDPKFAITVLVENAGWGSQTAAPIAMHIFESIKHYA